MKTRAVILAGGEGSRLGFLTVKRAKPAVPFAGKYRIIDFTLSNCVNSGIFDVMLLTQYRPHSLTDHIGVGRPWDLDRGFTGGIKIYPPYKGRLVTEWYRGTADAIQTNFTFVKHNNPDLVLILSGDHIYEMNYDVLITFHTEKRADVTICTLTVPREEAPRFGILATDENYRVTSFVEKPKDPPGNLASMGIYVFSLDVLDRLLLDDSKRRESSHDFGKDIIPRMLTGGYNVFAYPYTGYWVDVGTVDSYWQAHMDLLQHPSPLDFNDRSWIIHTKSEERPPVMIQSGATIKDSLITDGCVIAPGARVEHSVLSPGVYVGPKAVVRESIIFTDSYVEAGARVERAIVDKQVSIGHNAHIGHIEPKAEGLGITVVGKNTHVPNGMRVGRGAALGPDLRPEHFARKVVGRGKTLERPREI